MSHLTHRLRVLFESRPQMKYVFGVLLVLVVFSATWSLARAHDQAQFRVIYSLDARQNDQEIIKVINGAQSYVYFAVYYFSKKNIADALISAKNRGLSVRGIVDREGSLDASRAVVDKLTAAGISVETQKHLDGIMHVKAVVTDRAYASGSYNWTEAATESNDEVLEIGTDDSVRRQYLSIIKHILAVNQ